jgi:hypothetical protein
MNKTTRLTKKRRTLERLRDELLESCHAVIQLTNQARSLPEGCDERLEVEGELYAHVAQLEMDAQSVRGLDDAITDLELDDTEELEPAPR